MTEVNLGEMSIDDALAHYGVVGMKWGKTRAKASTVQIKAARGRVNREFTKVKKAESKAADVADPKDRAKAEKSAAQMRFLISRIRTVLQPRALLEAKKQLFLSLAPLPEVPSVWRRLRSPLVDRVASSESKSLRSTTRSSHIRH